MKIKGTKLDLPVPDGWTVSVDLPQKTVTMAGMLPDTTYYRNRNATYIFHLEDGDDGLELPWRRATVQCLEKREYQPHTYTPGKGWGGTGAWKRSRGNKWRNARDLIFEIAQGYGH